MQNEKGLIDMKKTEKLFEKRQRSQSRSGSDKSSQEGCPQGDHENRESSNLLNEGSRDDQSRPINTADILGPKTRKRRIEEASSQANGLHHKDMAAFDKYKTQNRFSQPEIGRLVEKKKSAFLNPLSSQKTNHFEIKSCSQHQSMKG